MARKTELAAVEPDRALTGDIHGAGSIAVRGAYDIPAPVYHADPCPRPSLSAHLAHLIVSKSPRHAWNAHPRLNPDFVPDNDSKFDLGRAAHLLMLEGVAPFELIDAPNWKSEAARDERAAVYREGKIPLLEHEYARVSAVVKSVRLQLRESLEARNAFRAGQGERSLIWSEGSVWLRARLDWIIVRRKGSPIEIWDFKTTEGSAEPAAWSNGPMFNLGFDIQASFYRRAVEAIYGRPAVFRFVVAEIDPPFGVSVVTLSPVAQEIADFEVERAVDAWRWCQRRKRWPGYSARTFHADAPVWKERGIEARKMQGAVDRDRGVNPYALSVRLWKP